MGRYRNYPLSLETVRVIDSVNRSQKAIRFALGKKLQMKVTLRLIGNV